MIDIHNHILPNIDDGSKSIEMSIKDYANKVKNIIDPQVKIKFNQDVKLDGVKRKKLDTSLATRNGWKAEMNFSKSLVKTIENFKDF